MVVHDQEKKHQKSKSNESKAEHNTALEGHIKCSVHRVASFFGGSHIGSDSNLHADVSRENRGQGTKQEGHSGVESTSFRLNSEVNHNCEHYNKDTSVQVLSLEESGGSVLNKLSDLAHFSEERVLFVIATLTGSDAGALFVI